MKKFRNVLCILLAAAAILSCSSCGIKNKGKTVMSLGNAKITDRMYGYWLSNYKADFISAYSDVKDTEEFWQSTLFGDVTAEKYLSDIVYEKICIELVSMYLYSEFRLSVPDEYITSTDNIISDLCETYGESKNEFNKYLSVFGINSDILKDIFIEESKTTLVYNHVFENNILTVGDNEKQEYVNNNYSKVLHIYINNEYDSKASKYDESGNFIKVPLDDEAKAAKDETVKLAEEALKNGEDFVSVYNKYSDETSYPEGYYLYAGIEGLPSELVTNAFTIEPGESKTFTSYYGTHIIKRVEMDEKPWENKANADFFDDFKDNVYEDVFISYLKGYFDKIEADKDAIAAISVKDAVPNYSLRYYN